MPLFFTLATIAMACLTSSAPQTGARAAGARAHANTAWARHSWATMSRSSHTGDYCKRLQGPDATRILKVLAMVVPILTASTVEAKSVQKRVRRFMHQCA